MNLSPHFSLEELVHSQTAARLSIDNTPSASIIGSLRVLAAGLEQVRAVVNRPIIVSSGYRCPKLNKAVGGAVNSQHMLGAAADILCPGLGTPLQLCRAIEASPIRFDQMIYEYGWCHISFTSNGGRTMLTLDPQTKKTTQGIVG